MSDSAFSARVVGLLLAAGITLFGLFAVLTAYAPDMGDGNDGGAHALSNGATGFSGIVQLVRATGTPVTLSRDPLNPPAGGLLVLTPAPGAPPTDIARLVAARVAQHGAAPVLLILPKWRTAPVPFGRRGWVQQDGVLPGPSLDQATVAVAPFSVVEQARRVRCCIIGRDGLRLSFPVPARERIIQVPDSDATKLVTILADSDGDAVLARLPSKDVYVLAEPDLLDNHGIRDPATAAAALALLRDLSGGGPVAFDLSLNGFARTRNLARLAFEPPFLAFTLALLAAAALAGLQGAVRFGSPRAGPRALAFGKRALVDNAAMLIRSARREPAMAARYARLMLDTAGAERGAPPGLTTPELARWLDRRATASPTFETLSAAADNARTRDDGLAAARALHDWKEDVTHDG